MSRMHMVSNDGTQQHGHDSETPISKNPNHEDIAALAYEKYVKSGYQEGRCEQNWTEAEKELMGMISEASSPETAGRDAKNAMTNEGAGGAIGDRNAAASKSGGGALGPKPTGGHSGGQRHDQTTASGQHAPRGLAESR